MTKIHPYKIDIDQSILDDLRSRIKLTRWPDQQTPADWSQGVPLDYLQSLATYWAQSYDWRIVESRLNLLPQFTTTIDGLDIHFIHIKSTDPTAQPLIMTHGWPGSIIEFLKVLEPLADPTADGKSDRLAFDIVCPCIPGYGFSAKPTQPGWGIERIAAAWDVLMVRLGYQSYFAQGGDWGAAITSEIGQQNLGHCRGIHVNMPGGWPTPEARRNPTSRDQLAFDGAHYYRDHDSGYSKQQSTRPQTIGYSLVDSPTGLLAWIVEKFWAWTDCDGDPENVLSKDEMLDNVMVYWLNASGASSARLYWESFGKTIKGEENQIKIPTGCSIFPKEIVPIPRSWAEQRYVNIVYWNELDRGGHFAAFEQPDLFVEELRNCFTVMKNLNG